jgi:Na+-transporting methylmalonyl-CoA/oxaloacetate decarboxylase gamma subunit
MWDFVAFLLGVLASVLGVGAVIALFLSARDAATRIAGANERASSAEERAAALEKEAAVAQLKLAQIENLTAWRRIRPDQREQIVQAIQDHLPPRIVIGYEQTDPEALTFAVDLETVFKAAGAAIIMRQAKSLYFIDGSPIFGVRVRSSPQFNSDTIEEAFAKAGWPFTKEAQILFSIAGAGRGPPGPGGLAPDPNPFFPSDLSLYVGHKPPAQ